MPGTGERGQDGRPVRGRREASGGDTRGTDDGSGGGQPGDGSGGDLPVPELANPAAAAAERLRDADSVLVVSHNDADGIASATVATRMLERADVPYELRFSRQLNEREVDRIAAYASGESPDIEASDLDELFRSYRDEVMAATDELEDAVDDVLDDEDGAIRASQRRRAFRTYRTEKQAAAVDRVERTIERLHGLRPEADDEAGVQTTLEDRNSWARADGSGGASVVGHLDPNDRGANDEQPVPPMTSDGDEKPDSRAGSEPGTADDGEAERNGGHAPTEGCSEEGETRSESGRRDDTTTVSEAVASHRTRMAERADEFQNRIETDGTELDAPFARFRARLTAAIDRFERNCPAAERSTGGARRGGEVETGSGRHFRWIDAGDTVEDAVVGIAGGIVCDDDEVLVTLAEVGAEESLLEQSARKWPDEETVDSDAGHDVVLFTDFGSGQLEEIRAHETAGAFTPVVTDHHEPADATTEHHLNPRLTDVSGENLSGSGTTYVLARAMAGLDGTNEGLSEPAASNRDLARPAVVGAVGDSQNDGPGLTGANRAVAAEGAATGVVETREGIETFGYYTRSLSKMLEYADSGLIPGVTGVAGDQESFVDRLNGDLPDGDDIRWADLDDEGRERFEREVELAAVTERGPEAGAEALSEKYFLPPETPSEEDDDESVARAKRHLNTAEEFATLLNSVGRYDHADIGVDLLRTDEALQRGGEVRGDAAFVLRYAGELRTEHSRNIGEAISRFERAVEGSEDGDGESGTELPTGRRKVSARAGDDLDVDLGAVMADAARAVGTSGGGHPGAAGASVPAGRRGEFLERVDELLGQQHSEEETGHGPDTEPGAERAY